LWFETANVHGHKVGLGMNAFAVAGILTGISSLVFGFFVFWNNPSRRLNQIWFAFTTMVGGWGIGSTWIALETDPGEALWAWRVSFALCVVWIPILFFHFVCLFCQIHKPRLLLSCYAIGIGFFPYILFSDQFFPSVRFTFSSFYYAQPGLLLVSFFTILWLGLTLYSHALLIQAYRHTSDIKRSQVQYFFLATAIGYSGGSLEFLPIFGIDLYPWGHFAIPLYPVVMAYAIARYRFMDISLAFEKSLAYLALVLMAAVPAYGFLLWAQQTYFGSISYPFSAILLLTFLFVVFGSYSIKRRTEETLKRTLFKRRHDTVQTISNFSKALVGILDFKILTDEIVQTLVQVLGVHHATLYTLDESKSAYSPVSIAGSEPPPSPPARIPVGEDLPLWLLEFHKPLVREEFEHVPGAQASVPVLGSLRLLHTEVCVPFINNKNRLIGFCTLGGRHDQSLYSQDELQLFTSLSHNAAIALDNAMMYRDLKQTQSLIERTHRLHSLEIMAGGFAHEVRNPLTSIKTFIQLAPQRVGNYEFLRKFGKIVTEDIARIERLTQEILDYSEQKSLHVQLENLNEILEACVNAIKLNLNGKDIQIEEQYGLDIPFLYLDRQQVQQVFLNLVSNAIDSLADEKGAITLSTRHQKGVSGENWVQVEVKDKGRGIPENELESIFEPYFTTKHESRERGGTGLGLTIVRQIVQAHGGSIEVKSVVGEGTVFLVNFSTSFRVPSQEGPSFHNSIPTGEIH
jgi:signal transduction histidine kinase